LQSVVLACKAYHEPTQQSHNIRKFTDDILLEYGLKLNESIYIGCDNEAKMVNKKIEHALTKPDIKCDEIQQLFKDVRSTVTHTRLSHNQTKLSKNKFAQYFIHFVDVTEALSSNEHPTLN
ncbi:unnamed protein product, partial [Didymodactylos carnosus]